ncbi:MAG TPA: hypothetical protein VK007_02520 [Acidimicrobiales bacterium]|nr:hypothetical protein [Acidimicrobiales bacterium]
MTEPRHQDLDDGVVMAVLARRLGMTEGQLYTTVIAALVVAVLTLTGLPGAHDLEDPTGAPAPPPAPTTTAAEGAP